MKIHSVAAEVFHAGRQADRRTDRNEEDFFFNSANASKNEYGCMLKIKLRLRLLLKVHYMKIFLTNQRKFDILAKSSDDEVLLTQIAVAIF